MRSTAEGVRTGINTAVVGIVSTTNAALAVDGFTIRDLQIEGSGRYNTFAGIYVGTDEDLILGDAPTGTMRGLQIIHNRIDSVSRPIHVHGVRTNFGTLNKPIVIDSNLIGTASPTTSWANDPKIGGIHVLGSRFVKIGSNTVTGAHSYSAYQFAGVRLDSCEEFEISRNHIYGLKHMSRYGSGMFGIAVILPATFSRSYPVNMISNNMIADIVGNTADSYTGEDIVSGIYVNSYAPSSSPLSDASLFLLHNSIHLFGTYAFPSYPGGGSAAICIGSSIRGGVGIFGNILQNSLTIYTASSDKMAVGIWIFNQNYTSRAIDYNAYRINSTGAVNCVAKVGRTNYITFGEWVSTFRESRGVELAADVPFVSSTDLHIRPDKETQIINAGDPSYLRMGQPDFDGQIRPLLNPGPGRYGDPGTAPDIGADELDGRPFTCPTALAAPNVKTTTPPNAGTSYLWDTPITLDTTGTSSPTASGHLQVIYSLDGGATWTAGPSVSSFPANFTLPRLTPPNYTRTILIALVATTPIRCPTLTPDTSDRRLRLNLTDRPGNRAANAIPLTLTPGSGGVWTVIVEDSTNGPATSNEFSEASGAEYGQNTRDLFFKLTLPACFDSIKVYTCELSSRGRPTNFDTYLHVWNATQRDTLSNSNGGDRSTFTFCHFYDGDFAYNGASRIIAYVCK